MEKKTSIEEALLSIFQKVKKPLGNQVFIVGEVNKISALWATRRFEQLENDSSFSEICIVLDSYGGDFKAARLICDIMGKCQKPIKIRSYNAQSAAALILAYGTKGMRFVYNGSKVMIHRVHVEFLGPNIGIIKRCIIRKFATLRNNMLMTVILSQKTGKTFTKIYSDARRQTYFSAPEAVVYGIADGVLPRDILE